jgi:hypothetical protein
MPTTPVTLVAGTIPGPNCYEGRQTDFNKMVAAITATVPSGYVGWIVQNGTPSAAQRSFLWLKLDTNGRPLQPFSWSVTDAAWLPFDDSHIYFGTATNVGNAYSVSIVDYAWPSLTRALYCILIPAANTSAVTLQVNSLTATAIVKGGTTPLIGGDLQAGVWILLTYDGTNLQMVSTPQSQLLPITEVFASGTFITTIATNLPVGTLTASLAPGTTTWIDIEVHAEMMIDNNNGGTGASATLVFQWNTAPLLNTNVTQGTTTGAGNSGESYSNYTQNNYNARWMFKGLVDPSINQAGTITVNAVPTFTAGFVGTIPGQSSTVTWQYWLIARCK